jgi:hypothetical protein
LANCPVFSGLSTAKGSQKSGFYVKSSNCRVLTNFLKYSNYLNNLNYLNGQKCKRSSDTYLRQQFHYRSSKEYFLGKKGNSYTLDLKIMINTSDKQKVSGKAL